MDANGGFIATGIPPGTSHLYLQGEELTGNVECRRRDRYADLPDGERSCRDARGRQDKTALIRRLSLDH